MWLRAAWTDGEGDGDGDGGGGCPASGSANVAKRTRAHSPARPPPAAAAALGRRGLVPRQAEPAGGREPAGPQRRLPGAGELLCAGPVCAEWAAGRHRQAPAAHGPRGNGWLAAPPALIYYTRHCVPPMLPSGPQRIMHCHLTAPTGFAFSLFSF